ncbi:MAG TPA: hypothetical protein VGF36_17730 [Rhodopila sp.]
MDKAARAAAKRESDGDGVRGLTSCGGARSAGCAGVAAGAGVSCRSRARTDWVSSAAGRGGCGKGGGGGGRWLVALADDSRNGSDREGAGFGASGLTLSDLA